MHCAPALRWRTCQMRIMPAPPPTGACRTVAFPPALPEVAVTEVMTPAADAGGEPDSIAERDKRIETLRGKYRSLQEIDARQRSILDELAAIDAIDDPDGGDFIWQGSLIREHDDLEHMAAKPRKRAKD